MADKVSVKVSFKEDLRRLPGSTLTAYATLRQKIADLYGAVLPDGFTIKYQDEEKDLISVTSDLELQEAVREAARQPNTLLRLMLFAPANAPQPKPAEAAAHPVPAPSPAPAASHGSAPAAQPVNPLLSSLAMLNDPKLGIPGPQAALLSSILQAASAGDMAQLMTALTTFPVAAATPTPAAAAAPVPTPTPAPAPPVAVAVPEPAPAPPVAVAVPEPAPAPKPEPTPAPTPVDATKSPTAAAAAVTLPIAVVAEPAAKAEPVLRVEFVQHENFPEETEVECGVQIVKVWRIKNSGTAPWPAGTYAVPDGGAVPAAASHVAIEREVLPGEEYSLGIAVCTPKEPGVCQAAWRLKTPAGRSFDDPVYLNLKIVRPKAAKEAPASDLPAPIAFTVPPTNVVSVPQSAVLAAATNSPSPKPDHVAMQQAIAQAQLNHNQMSEQDKLLKHLAEMGFTERETNIRLLAKHNNNILAVIGEIIGA